MLNFSIDKHTSITNTSNTPNLTNNFITGLICGKSYNKADSDYIYTDSLGNRIKPNYLTSAFPEFIVKNGFKRMRFHDLRHSCASLLLANGVSLKEIQEWLGHSDFAITANIYAHLEFDSKLKSADRMAWIHETSLASGIEAPTPIADTANQDDGSLQTALPNFMHKLMITGISIEAIQAWLKQAEIDYASGMSLADSFREFHSVSMA